MEIIQAMSPAQGPIHPLNGQGVLAVLPHGFIHYGTLIDDGFHPHLVDASNLRYWSKRAGGLPAFAADGPVQDDLIDKIGTVYLVSVLFFYPLGEWYAK